MIYMKKMAVQRILGYTRINGLAFKLFKDIDCCYIPSLQ